MEASLVVRNGNKKKKKTKASLEREMEIRAGAERRESGSEAGLNSQAKQSWLIQS